MTMGRSALLILLTMALAGCELPRGAALQSEVLGPERDGGGRPIERDFEIVPLTRANLPAVMSWPAVGTNKMGWLARKPQQASYIIAPGDRLNVTVWDAEQTSLIATPGTRATPMLAVPVSLQGNIFLPFVGNIKVSGLSPEAAREKIEAAYLATSPSIQVQLSAEPGRANTANLVSGAASPGVYPLADRDMTVLTLLAMGGGAAPGLANPQVRLFRGSRAYGIALSRLYEDPKLDTTLQGGDRVIVEADDRAFLSLGSGGQQSRHVFPKENMTVLDALALAGGANAQRSDIRGILVLRNYPASALRPDGGGPKNDRVVFVVDLTAADGMFSAGKLPIMPDDLIYFTESPVTQARTVLALIGAALGIAAVADVL